MLPIIFGHGDGNLPSHSIINCLVMEVEANALFGCWNTIGIVNDFVSSLERKDAEVRISL
jgi:hypothetical protein